MKNWVKLVRKNVMEQNIDMKNYWFSINDDEKCSKIRGANTHGAYKNVVMVL